MALICQYDKVNKKFQYYQSGLFSLLSGSKSIAKYINLCDDKIYFILRWKLGYNISHLWAVFDTNSFTEVFSSSDFAKYHDPPLPCSNNLNYTQFYLNNREWNQKVDCYFECDPNLGEEFNCKTIFRMFLFSKFE